MVDIQAPSNLQVEPTCQKSAAETYLKLIYRQLVSICRPELLEPHLFPASAPGGLPSSAGGTPSNKVRRRSWASSDYLAQRLQQFSGYLKV